MSDGKTTRKNQACEVKIKDLGSVVLVRTEEGIEIDVKKGNQSIRTITVENEAFQDPYETKVLKYIKMIEPKATLDNAFITLVSEANLSAIAAAEKWLSEFSFNIDELVPLKGKASGFYEETKKLARPYIKISEEEYFSLMEEKNDYFKTPSGRVVTLGTIKHGYALIPLRKKFMKKIIKENE